MCVGAGEIQEEEEEKFVRKNEHLEEKESSFHRIRIVFKKIVQCASYLPFAARV